MTDTDASSAKATTPLALDYGREASRLRRFRRVAIVLLILASIAGGVWFAVPRVLHSIRLKSAIAECNAWAEKARTTVLPEGTVLYGETQEDFVAWGNGVPQWKKTTIAAGSWLGPYVSFAERHAEMREVAFLAGGIPILSDFRNMVYVHEHPLWLASAGSPPPVFSVYYIGPDAAGNPQFGITARMFPLDSNGRSNMVGGIAASPPPGRPLMNLRLFAGQPNPADPTRFHVPFSCNAGTGRFEFQTDTDASDGGDTVPKLTITWDATPTTQANQP